MHIMPGIPLKMWAAMEKGDYALAAKMRDTLLPFLLKLSGSGLGGTATYKLLDMHYGFAGGPARYPNLPKVQNVAELQFLIDEIDKIRSNPIFA